MRNWHTGADQPAADWQKPTDQIRKWSAPDTRKERPSQRRQIHPQDRLFGPLHLSMSTPRQITLLPSFSTHTSTHTHTHNSPNSGQAYLMAWSVTFLPLALRCILFGISAAHSNAISSPLSPWPSYTANNENSAISIREAGFFEKRSVIDWCADSRSLPHPSIHQHPPSFPPSLTPRRTIRLLRQAKVENGVVSVLHFVASTLIRMNKANFFRCVSTEFSSEHVGATSHRRHDTPLHPYPTPLG